MFLSLVLSLQLCAPVALDQDAQIAEAKRLHQTAVKAFQAENYLVAIAAFEAAYAVAPRATTGFSLAQAYRLQYLADGDHRKLKRAVELYQAYLKEVAKGGRSDHARQHLGTLQPILQRLESARRNVVNTSQPTQLMLSSQIEGAMGQVDEGDMLDLPAIVDVNPGEHRVRFTADGYQAHLREVKVLTGRILAIDGELQPLPGRVHVVAEDGAEISIDGRIEGRAPLLQTMEMKAGRHLLSVTETGHHPFIRELNLRRGEEVRVTAELSITSQRVLSYVFLATGAGLGVLSGLSTLRAINKEQNARETEAKIEAKTSIKDRQEIITYNEQISDRDVAVNWAVGLGVGAVVTGGVGALLYFLDTPAVPMPRWTSQLAVVPNAGGVALAYSGRL